MAKFTGKNDELRAAATFTAGAWTDCTTAKTFHGNSNSCQLTLTNAVQDCGIVQLRFLQSTDGGGTYIPIYDNNGDRLVISTPALVVLSLPSVVIPGPNFPPQSVIKVQFNAASGTTATLAISMADYETEVANVSISQNIGDVEVSLEAGVKVTVAGNLTTYSATGAGVIALTTGALATNKKLKLITGKFSAAPTTSESLTITKDNVTGAAYDAVVYTINPSVGSVTSFAVECDIPFYAGDICLGAFTNTDARTVGLQLVFEG
jgi:hypothetical protein